MHRLFDSHIRKILDERKPKTLLEIGVLRGESTLQLLQWCSENGAKLTSLDPVAWEGDLPEEVKRPVEGYKYKRGKDGFEDWSIVPVGVEEAFRRGLDIHWNCLKERSLDYLQSPEFKGFDIYLIDGDHNYYTVTQELTQIHKYFTPGDAVLFNDVAGAYARRDLYYDPDFIPAEYQNGRKQGVLNAINDFLDSLSKKQLWRRKNCPYEFRILTKKNNGLGVLTRQTGGARPNNEEMYPLF